MNVLAVPLLTVVALDLCKQKIFPTYKTHRKRVENRLNIYGGFKNFTKRTRANIS